MIQFDDYSINKTSKITCEVGSIWVSGVLNGFEFGTLLPVLYLLSIHPGNNNYKREGTMHKSVYFSRPQLFYLSLPYYIFNCQIRKTNENDGFCKHFSQVINNQTYQQEEKEKSNKRNIKNHIISKEQRNKKLRGIRNTNLVFHKKKRKKNRETKSKMQVKVNKI